MRDKKTILKNYAHFNGKDGTLLEMTSMNTLEVLIDLRDILAKFNIPGEIKDVECTMSSPK